MQDMIARTYTRQVVDKLEKFPAVALLGARQCGKTTLAQALGGAYFDMESEGSQTRLDAEWDELAGGSELVIIGEAQRAPGVFSRLRGTIKIEGDRLLVINPPGWLQTLAE